MYAIKSDSGFSDIWYAPPQLPDELNAAQAYANVSIARRAVDIIANSAQTLPHEIVQGEEVVTDEYALIDQAETINRAITYAAVFGQWYAKRKIVAGRIKLELLFPPSVNYVYERGELVAFRRNTQRGQEIYRVDDPNFIWWWEQNLEGEQGPGRSMLATALKEANLINASNVYSFEWYRRGGSVRQAFVSGNPQPAEMTKLQEYLRRIYTGFRNMFSVQVLRDNIKIESIGEDPKSGDVGNITKGAEERLLAALGVPASKVFANAANYATASQDDRNMITDSSLPLAQRAFVAPVNRWVFMPQGVKFEYRPNLYPAFQESNLQMSQALMPLIEAGIISKQYAQEVLHVPISPTRVSPPPQPAPTAPTQSNLATVDMERWQRKALSALERGKSAGVQFASDYIPVSEHARISAALKLCATADEVRGVFRGQPLEITALTRELKRANDVLGR